MALLWPWGLLVLGPVVAAAAWALRRPMQRIVPVSSLRLWAKAVAAAGPPPRSSRRLSASWALLLAGAVLAAGALARPVFSRQEPARRVAWAVVPSAELAGKPGAPAEAAKALAARLDGRDRVRLILPAVLARGLKAASMEGEWLTPAEAARHVAELPILPARAEDLSLTALDGDVQHVYRIEPATGARRAGPGETDIVLPARPGAVTIDAFAAEPTAEGRAKVFVAVRNHTDRPAEAVVRVGGPSGEPTAAAISLPAGGRVGRTIELPAADAFLAAIDGQSGPGARAALVRRDAAEHTIALVGRDDPLIRRFVEVSPNLRLAAAGERADAVFVIDAEPPAAGPALVVNPPGPPAGWRRGEPLTHVALTRVALDHPVVAHVDLAGVAVRQATPWRAGPGAAEQAVATIGDDALILVAADPRRVYVALDLAGTNTNLATSESFVVLLTNIVEFLLPDRTGPSGYESLSPIAAGHIGGWRAASSLLNGGTDAGGPVPQPGLYTDSAGRMQAVSLTGLRSAEAALSVAEQIAGAELPAPAPVGRTVPLAPILLAVAVACWLGGWALRLR